MKSRRFALAVWIWKRRVKFYVEDVRFALTNPRAALNEWHDQRVERRKERLEWQALSAAEKQQFRADVRRVKAALNKMRKNITALLNFEWVDLWLSTTARRSLLGSVSRRLSDR